MYVPHDVSIGTMISHREDIYDKPSQQIVIQLGDNQTGRRRTIHLSGAEGATERPSLCENVKELATILWVFTIDFGFRRASRLQMWYKDFIRCITSGLWVVERG